MARLFVIVATLGRADLTARTVDLLAEQSRPPDGVVVAGVTPADVAGVEKTRLRPEILLCAKGSCRQRNRALDAVSERADIVVFFDDDFVPAPDYLEQVERVFAQDANVVGITGELLADGAGAGGRAIEFDDAVAMVSQSRNAPGALRSRQALYGCNMACRWATAKDLRFDEMLPLYGWQEDVDFTYRLGQRGRLVSGPSVTGVHLGYRGGRTSGRRFGYSQVANIIYLARKGTMPLRLGRRLLLRNVAANVAKSLRPEPHIDRRGRLLGNFTALSDFVRGRIDPRRIEEM